MMNMYPPEFNRIHPFGVSTNHVAMSVIVCSEHFSYFKVEVYNRVTARWEEVSNSGSDFFSTRAVLDWVESHYGWKKAASLKRLIRSQD